MASPLTPLKIFLHLLMEARLKAGEVEVAGETVAVERGEIVTTYGALIQAMGTTDASGRRRYPTKDQINRALNRIRPMMIRNLRKKPIAGATGAAMRGTPSAAMKYLHVKIVEFDSYAGATEIAATDALIAPATVAATNREKNREKEEKAPKRAESEAPSKAPDPEVSEDAPGVGFDLEERKALDLFWISASKARKVPLSPEHRRQFEERLRGFEKYRILCAVDRYISNGCGADGRREGYLFGIAARLEGWEIERFEKDRDRGRVGQKRSRERLPEQAGDILRKLFGGDAGRSAEDESSA